MTAKPPHSHSLTPPKGMEKRIGRAKARNLVDQDKLKKKETSDAKAFTHHQQTDAQLVSKQQIL